MTTNSIVRLPMSTYVNQIALYSNKLLVLSNNRLEIFDLLDESYQKRAVDSVLHDQYLNTRKTKIKLAPIKQHPINFKCKTIALCSEHFILVGKDYVCALSFEGQCTTSWKFKDTFINCCKVVGGVPGQENILIGTHDGRVLVLRIGNRFAIEAVRHMLPINDVAINVTRNMIAIIDSVNKLYVYDYLSSAQLSG